MKTWLQRRRKIAQTWICCKGTSNVKDSLKYGLTDDFRVADVFFLIRLPLSDNVSLTAESTHVKWCNSSN